MTAPKELKEVLAGLYSLLFLGNGQQFGYLAGRLLYKAKINSEMW